MGPGKFKLLLTANSLNIYLTSCPLCPHFANTINASLALLHQRARSHDDASEGIPWPKDKIDANDVELQWRADHVREPIATLTLIPRAFGRGTWDIVS